MNEKTKVPTWQTAIRKAQIAQQELKRIADENLAQMNAELAKKSGQILARLLKLGFDIEVEAPTTNEIILDGFRFWFSNYQENQEEDPTHNSLFFNLYVRPVKPNEFDWDGWVGAHQISVKWKRLNEDWASERAELANALDALADEAENVIKSRAHYLSTRPEKPIKKPTVESLIKALIQTALDEHVSTYHESD